MDWDHPQPDTEEQRERCPKTHSDNAARSIELNGVTKTQELYEDKTRHRFQAHSVELEKSVYKQKRLFI